MVGKLVLTALGVIVCAGCSSVAKTTTESPSLLPSLVTPADGHRASSSMPIKHIVVIIQENRSFDNFFAGYPGADAPTYGVEQWEDGRLF